MQQLGCAGVWISQHRVGYKTPWVVKMSRCLFAAFVCALMPLVTGTAIFCAWELLRWDGLMLAGFAMIYAGTALFAIGFSCLLFHVVRSPRTKTIGFWRSHGTSVLAGTLLLANFPIAAVYAVTAINDYTIYELTVENGRGQPLESFIVSGGGVHIDFGTISPGAIEYRRFHILQDGELSYRFDSGGVEHIGIIDGYVTNGMSSSKLILIDANGATEVSDHDD